MRAKRVKNINFVQIITNFGSQNQLIFTSSEKKDTENSSLLQLELFKHLPEPLENFSFHLKLAPQIQTISLQTNLSNGNYLGFEAIHSSENLDIYYKYGFLLLNFIKGLKLSSIYYKNNIHLDVNYKVRNTI
jgi:hypothetical protein